MRRYVRIRESVELGFTGAELETHSLGAFQVPEYPFYRILVLLAGIAHEPAHHSDCISDIRWVHTIVYIKLPTAEAYGTFTITAFSAFVFGLCLPNNLQFAGSADPTGLASDMLNR